MSDYLVYAGIFIMGTVIYYALWKIYDKLDEILNELKHNTKLNIK